MTPAHWLMPWQMVARMGRKERFCWGVLGLSFVLAMLQKLTGEWTTLMIVVTGALCGADAYNTGAALKHGKAPPDGTTG